MSRARYGVTGAFRRSTAPSAGNATTATSAGTQNMSSRHAAVATTSRWASTNGAWST